MTSAKGVVESRRGGPPQKVVVSAEDFAKINVPLLQVNPESSGGSDFLQRAATRRDSNPGTVEVWKSSDNAQIFLRNGVVVGTRGVGRDIIAADANMTVRAVQNRRGASGIRSFIVSDGDVTSQNVRYRCEIRNVGVENISIANQSITVDHLSENCTGGPAGNSELRNDYWVQRSTGLIRKSRQWISPAVGYFEILLLKN
ncbi:DUF2886 domain containing protein [Sulfitobacter donghicola DSW-25 = KCTC 12864 = JCM 14565]|nr:DUF2886 domain containing protein [Sulfitobacter donghicola DSW-25 = KCTC 12864 = JCM 14565]